MSVATKGGSSRNDGARKPTAAPVTDDLAVVLVEIDPGYGAAQFFDDWYQLAGDGHLNGKGDTSFLQAMALFHPHIGDLMAVPGIPLGLQRALARSLGWLARRSGLDA